MSDGKWSGGVANRTWSRGTSVTGWPGDDERSPRLYEQHATSWFLCETCGRNHALAEHRQCRAAEAARPNPGHT